MKKVILISILNLYSLFLFSQNNQYSSDSISVTTWISKKYWTLSESRDTFPDKINQILDAKMLRWFSNDLDKTSFRYGISFDLEVFYNENPDELFNTDYSFPSYVFFYVYSDTLKGIKRYDFYLEFDSFGQLQYMGFPRNRTLKSFDFLSLDESKQIADSLINLELQGYSEPYINLQSDEELNELYWEFSYNDGNTELGGKVYHYAISLIDKCLIEERTYINTLQECDLLPQIEDVELMEQILIEKR